MDNKFVYKTFVEQIEGIHSGLEEGAQAKQIQAACDLLSQKVAEFVNQAMQGCDRIEGFKFYQRVFYPPASTISPRDPMVTAIINFTMIGVKTGG